jgi:hypothetical protein
MVDDGTHLNPSTTRLYLKKTKSAYSSRSLVLCVCFVDRCLSFVLFLLAIVLYVLLQYTDSDYPFDYLQTLLHTRCLVGSVLLIYLVFLLCGVPNVGSVS